MVEKLYSIFDSVANEYGPIQHCKNDGVALRMFEASLSKSTTKDDFHLYCVGEIETETGEIQPNLFKVKVSMKTEVEE